jgi:hypothetical protein
MAIPQMIINFSSRLYFLCFKACFWGYKMNFKAKKALILSAIFFVINEINQPRHKKKRGGGPPLFLNTLL